MPIGRRWQIFEVDLVGLDARDHANVPKLRALLEQAIVDYKSEAHMQVHMAHVIELPLQTFID
jgi:hypothetical protein